MLTQSRKSLVVGCVPQGGYDASHDNRRGIHACMRLEAPVANLFLSFLTICCHHTALSLVHHPCVRISRLLPFFLALPIFDVVHISLGMHTCLLYTSDAADDLLCV